MFQNKQDVNDNLSLVLNHKKKNSVCFKSTPDQNASNQQEQRQGRLLFLSLSFSCVYLIQIVLSSYL